MTSTSIRETPCITPPLDAQFRPLVLANRAFQAAVQASGAAEPLVIAVERGDGTISRYATQVIRPGVAGSEKNLPYVERLVKTLLWSFGGWKVYVGGPAEIGEAIRAMYAEGGSRAFDADVMGRIYERQFTVVPSATSEVPAAKETSSSVGGHLEGCRIGFDAGASDRKVAAVIDGEAVYSEEVIWDPRPQTDPQFHFDEIMTAMRTAASNMPRVDAIGVSSAGVYINNRIMIASLFRGVSKELFEKRVKGLFLEIQQAWGGIPLEVVNDGDVTALAGAMSLNDTAVIGVAMGSSEAAGYVNPDGNITNWLNELAFVPIDAAAKAPADEWSGDIGCGVQYLSQQAVGRLIPQAGITVDAGLGLPERLKAVQEMFAAGDQRVRPIYETIGIYLGYALAHYADYYDFRHALILGRVTSGDGGAIILEYAKKVLAQDFPELAAKVAIALPDESNRRVGQAIAAASLPEVK
ncbi:MAG TPA: ROK family protein [Armatimonadota bacterium]